MADHAVDDVEYYEEEILSYYDAGLSTIMEGENESSCSDTFANATKSPTPANTIPENISVNPNALKLLSLDSPCISLTSPGMLSKPKTFNIAALISPPPMSDNTKFKPISPLSLHPPLTLTSLATGEEYVIDDDDDEYTFVSVSENEEHHSYSDASVASSKSTSSLPLDFETTRFRLQKALENKSVRGRTARIRS